MTNVAQESTSDNSIPILATATIIDDDVSSTRDVIVARVVTVAEHSHPTVTEQQSTDIDSPGVTVTVIPIINSESDGKCVGVWLFALLLLGFWLLLPQLKSTDYGTTLVSCLITIASTIVSSTLAWSWCCCCQYNLSPKRQKLAKATLVTLFVELLIQLLLLFREILRIRAAIGMSFALHILAMIFSAVFIWGNVVVGCCRMCMK